MPHVNAAILASQSGRLDEAIGYLRTALRAAPRNGAANLNLGLALAETGDTAQAEAHLRTALADPDCRAQAAYNLAVLIGPRDPAAAADLCRTALELEPGNPRYQEALEYFKSGIRN
ncbi:MAG: tetratricopeptide repeat protein [Kiritimatiellaeota bacterium]|nr:tetratricopeptide repeat protein [Kiritimatiellota bacterium]